MNAKLIYIAALALYLGVGSPNVVHASVCNSNRSEVVNTDAGNIDFTFVSYIKYPKAFHKIQKIDLDDRSIVLDDGSHWKISKTDIVKGWDREKNLVVTQNHAGLSTSRYALVNVDLKLAVPASLECEPTPDKEAYYVKGVDRVNDIITLSDSKNWIVHSSDRGTLSKVNLNDRVVIGANTGDNRDKSPYLLIDTSSNHFVRAHPIE